MPKPTATLSIDMDDAWAYQRTAGRENWASADSILPLATPRVVNMLRDFAATFFLIGEDVNNPKLGTVFEQLKHDSFEIASHSYSHRTDFHRLGRDEIHDELQRSEAAIIAATGYRPRGFRAPSFRLSSGLITALAARGYSYDASAFPNSIGPLARWWHFRSIAASTALKLEQSDLFGNFADARTPLRAHRIQVGDYKLLEIPVTTFPLVRLPMHFTYINFIADSSETLAEKYFSTALQLCRIFSLAPSILLHATDFVGNDDAGCPTFLPGMRRSATAKLAFTQRLLRTLTSQFRLKTLVDYAEEKSNDASLKIRTLAA